MSYRNDDDQKITRRFDNLIYSDPEYVVFVYSPDIKHLRLLELEKQVKNNDNGQNDYFHNFRGNNSNNLNDNFIFIPKRCVMLDNQLTVIQKQQQGRPINYHVIYKFRVNQHLKKRIYTWYTNNSQSNLNLNNNNNNSSLNLFKQYCSYPEINTFCFGRKYFVRSINSIDLSSDLISRSHCELMIKKGKSKNDMQKFFEMIFGVYVRGKGLQVRQYKQRENLSKGNKLHLLTRQLWQIIYSYIFLSKDKYFLVDNGSRNGTFFIECPNKLSSKINYQTQLNQYNTYGKRITTNHKLQIKQGYSYQFQGQEYLMKVWRLIQCNRDTNNIIKEHNKGTINYIQQFDEKVSWFNNFEKANKDYIIDEELTRRDKWKGKKVYEEMLVKNREKIDERQMLMQWEENQFITKSEFVRMICQEVLLQQKISDYQSQNQNHTSLFISQHQLNTIVVSLQFNNDYKKIYCIITQTNRGCKFHLGSQMVLNTARFQFEESQKCNGYVEFDGKGWSVVALAAIDSKERNGKNEDDESGKESDLEKDSQDFIEILNSNRNNTYNRINQQPCNLNLFNKLSNKIWTKIPATSLYQLNPQKYPTYLIRLSHSFYFQLKFINFENSKTKIGN